jgi:hypothetical protein
MLRLDVPPNALPGGALLGVDDRDPSVAWVVPAALSVAQASDGRPSFTLFRQSGAYGTGGNLSVELQPALPDVGAAAAGRTVRVVPLRTFAARLRVTDESGVQPLSWSTGTASGNGTVLLGASFTPREIDALSPALDARPSPVVADAVFSYAGVCNGLPLVASVKLSALADRLRATLPAGPVLADGLAATGVAALALDGSLYTLTPTDDRALPGDRTPILTEIVARLLPTLAVITAASSPDGADTATLVTGSLAATVQVDLSSPRIEVRRAAATWSVGDFLAGLDPAARARALPSLNDPDVLSLIAVQVMTSAPFDDQFLTRIDVGLRFRDASGKIQQPPAAQLSRSARTQTIDVVRNVLAPLQIERRITAVVSPQGAARVVQQPYATTGPVVDVDGDALGLRFVVVTVDANVFGLANALVLRFRLAADPNSPPACQVTLDASTPAATVVVPGAAPGQPVWASIQALPPAGSSLAPVSVGDRAADGRVDVSVADVMPQAPVQVTVARATSVTADRYPTVTVTLRAPGNPEVLLKVGAAPRTFNLFPPGPFTAPAFDYKVDWIDTTRGFEPIAGAFHSASGTSLSIDPQTEPRA